MSRWKAFAIAAVLLVGGVVPSSGCKEDGYTTKQPAPAPAPGANVLPGDGATRTLIPSDPRGAPGGGSVKGVVSFKGTAPEGEEIPAKRCHAKAADVVVGPVVADEQGRLKDVMVYVKSAPPAGGSAVGAPVATGPGGPVVLDQVNCEYVPRVVGVRVGQVLRVKSSDPTLHNVHTLPIDNDMVNFGMTGAGQTRDLTFKRAESFKVKCDVHPWMSAQVYVFEHPYFATTGEDGGYEINGLPPGAHTLVFSHPFLGDRERQVAVPGEGSAEVSETFEKGE